MLARLGIGIVVVMFGLTMLPRSVSAGVPPPGYVNYYWAAPYPGYAMAGMVKSTTGSGIVKTSYTPTMNLNTGHGNMGTMADAAFAGAAEVTTHVGLSDAGFVWKKPTGYYTVTYSWIVTFGVDAIGTIPFPGGGAMKTTGYVHGNLYCMTTHTWVLNGDLKTKIWNAGTLPAPCIWEATGVLHTYTVSFSAYMVYGMSYSLYTKVVAWSYVTAIGTCHCYVVSEVDPAGVIGAPYDGAILNCISIR